MITFIANSGIQFYRFEAPFDQAAQRSFRVRYIERFDSLRRRFWLDEALPLDNEGRWARRQQLQDLGLLNGQGRLVADADLSGVEVLDESELFESGGFNQLFKHFERRWMPLPFFKRNNIHNDSFGPTDWVRLHFERSGEGTLRMVLAVDTTTTRNNQVFNFCHTSRASPSRRSGKGLDDCVRRNRPDILSSGDELLHQRPHAGSY